MRKCANARCSTFRVEVDGTDRILALVTCSYELPDARFILFCRQLRPEETPEAMAQKIHGDRRGEIIFQSKTGRKQEFGPLSPAGFYFQASRRSPSPLTMA